MEQQQQQQGVISIKKDEPVDETMRKLQRVVEDLAATTIVAQANAGIPAVIGAEALGLALKALLAGILLEMPEAKPAVVEFINQLRDHILAIVDGDSDFMDTLRKEWNAVKANHESLQQLVKSALFTDKNGRNVIVVAPMPKEAT